MAWQRLAVVVAGAQAQGLADALEEEGAAAVDIADADAGTEREQAVFGEPGADAGLWPHCRIVALFADGADVDTALARAGARAGLAELGGASVDRLQDEDWVALTQRQFEPIRAGERLWIVPTWHEAPDATAINVVLDPGAAFGTGSHPTTRLCLGWLEARIHGGEHVLDYGCGSGILGIAALKLGAASALGVDVDPLAVQAARYNARRNEVDLEVVDAQATVARAADVTVANILANPLRMLAPLLCSHTRPGGALALSGILAEQAAGVIEAYAPWACLQVAGSEAGWVLLAGARDAC